MQVRQICLLKIGCLQSRRINHEETASTVENLPIKEESIVWTSEPVLNVDGTVDKDSADYTVAGIADGINGLVIALKVRAKNA